MVLYIHNCPHTHTALWGAVCAQTPKSVDLPEYVSAVGKAENSYLLTGCFDADGVAIGWTVNWKNKIMNL